MARQQRRTLSSLIENLIEDACKRESVEMISPKTSNYTTTNVAEAMKYIWHPEEHVRFAAFAMYLPDLLTGDEQCLWAFIQSRRYFWSHYKITVENALGC